MDPVEIQTSITLSKQAIAAFGFGLVLERRPNDTVGVFGGEEIDDGATTTFTAGTGDTVVSTQTGIFNTSMWRFTVTALADNGVCAYYNFPAGSLPDWSELAVSAGTINLLIKSNLALAAGDLLFATGMDGVDLKTTPDKVDVPAIVVDTWTYVQIPMTTAAIDLVDLLSYGFICGKGAGLTAVIDVQWIGMSVGTNYDFTGIGKNDEARNDDTCEIGDDITVLARGHINAEIGAAVTCVATQPLYPAPGTGKLSTTAISYPSTYRQIRATEDQLVAGTQTGVML